MSIKKINPNCLRQQNVCEGLCILLNTNHKLVYLLNLTAQYLRNKTKHNISSCKHVVKFENRGYMMPKQYCLSTLLWNIRRPIWDFSECPLCWVFNNGRLLIYCVSFSIKLHFMTTNEMTTDTVNKRSNNFGVFWIFILAANQIATTQFIVN